MNERSNAHITNTELRSVNSNTQAHGRQCTADNQWHCISMGMILRMEDMLKEDTSHNFCAWHSPWAWALANADDGAEFASATLQRSSHALRSRHCMQKPQVMLFLRLMQTKSGWPNFQDHVHTFSDNAVGYQQTVKQALLAMRSCVATRISKLYTLSITTKTK